MNTWDMAKRRTITGGSVDWAAVYKEYTRLGGKTTLIILLLPVGRVKYVGEINGEYKYETLKGEFGVLSKDEFITAKKSFKTLKEGKTWQECL